MGNKTKRIITIGGFKVKDLYAPTLPNAYINSKGDLVVSMTKRGRGRPRKDAPIDVIKTRAELEAERERYRQLSGKELGGVSTAELTKQERAKLKAWGFTESVIRKLAFSQDANYQMQRDKKTPLSLEHIVSQVDKTTGVIKTRKARRSKASPLYSGKTALASRREFISGAYYEKKEANYKDNWIKAIESGNLKTAQGDIPQQVKDGLLHYLKNGGDVNKLPSLAEVYRGMILSNTQLKSAVMIINERKEKEAIKHAKEVVASMDELYTALGENWRESAQKVKDTEARMKMTLQELELREEALKPREPQKLITTKDLIEDLAELIINEGEMFSDFKDANLIVSMATGDKEKTTRLLELNKKRKAKK